MMITYRAATGDNYLPDPKHIKLDFWLHRGYIISQEYLPKVRST